MQGGRIRLLQSLAVLITVNKTKRIHASQHVVATFQGAFRVADRIIRRGGLGQTGNHGNLRDAQLVDGQAIIDLGGGGDTVSALPKIDFVEIKLKNFLLAQMALNFKRQKNLGELAEVGFFTAEEKVARHLHGDGTATLPLFTGTDQLKHRADQALIIHAWMHEKTVILGRQYGVYHRLRQILVANRCPALLAKFGNQFTIRRKNP